jgi:hypothetical protein
MEEWRYNSAIIDLGISHRSVVNLLLPAEIPPYPLGRRLGGSQICRPLNTYVIFEVSTAVTMKNGVFWDVMPCVGC